MRWTLMEPREPGYYWQRGYGGTPGLLRVVEVATCESDGDASLHVYVGGWEPGLAVSAPEFDECEWAGPIPKPDEALSGDVN